VICLSGRGFSLYDKSITVRVNAEQYEKYKKFCLAKRVQLNELVRFLLDRAVANDDKELMKVIGRYESLNTLRILKEIGKK
jgi:hypothetical protein